LVACSIKCPSCPSHPPHRPCRACSRPSSVSSLLVPERRANPCWLTPPHPALSVEHHGGCSEWSHYPNHNPQGPCTQPKCVFGRAAWPIDEMCTLHSSGGTEPPVSCWPPCLCSSGARRVVSCGLSPVCRAEYDLIHKLAPFMDVHLLFPVLNYYLVKGVRSCCRLASCGNVCRCCNAVVSVRCVCRSCTRRRTSSRLW